MKKVSKNVTLSKRLLFWLLVTIALLGFIHLTLQYVNISIYNEKSGLYFELSNRFDFDDESSVPTWVNQFLFILISFASVFLAYIEKQRAKKMIWSVASVVALLGSLDEVAALHEFILQRLHLFSFNENAPTAIANAWLVVLPLVIIAIGFFIYKAFAQLPKRTLGLLIVSLLIFIVGAIIVDIWSSSDVNRISFKNQGILVAIEEMMELIGLSIALYAIIDYIEEKYSKQIVRAKRELLK